MFCRLPKTWASNYFFLLATTIHTHTQSLHIDIDYMMVGSLKLWVYEYSYSYSFVHSLYLCAGSHYFIWKSIFAFFTLAMEIVYVIFFLGYSLSRFYHIRHNKWYTIKTFKTPKKEREGRGRRGGERRGRLRWK